jgi:DHA3 family multidrug efflux protein-like MFS transporter
MASFHQLLINNLAANITNYTVWFALTFWMFLETGSVFATGMIAGIYLALTSGLGLWFGSLVDHHRKRSMMIVSSLVSLASYALALLLFWFGPAVQSAAIGHPALWIFVLLTMAGVIAGNIRMIALATLVTLLIPDGQRDKANGLVGIVNGIGILTTSAISGFLIAWGGMEAALAAAMLVSLLAICHLLAVRVPEERPSADAVAAGRMDLAGTLRMVAAIPGLFALILFTAFNNFLGGVFMALIDAYGLSLMSVEHWGLMWAAVSSAFILSGALIARTGLGTNPVRTLLLANLVSWAAAAAFTVQSSVPLLAAGCFLFMLLGPFAEAAEQTILQKVVPFERQGRIFGFAQSVESAASPLTAFLIAPIAQFIFVPFMTNGAGAEAIGDWFGRGTERGIALLFCVAGLIGVLATIAALFSKSYRDISKAYVESDGSRSQA